jgi:hypothetical protein
MHMLLVTTMVAPIYPATNCCASCTTLAMRSL